MPDLTVILDRFDGFDPTSVHQVADVLKKHNMGVEPDKNYLLLNIDGYLSVLSAEESSWLVANSPEVTNLAAIARREKVSPKTDSEKEFRRIMRLIGPEKTVLLMANAQGRRYIPIIEEIGYKAIIYQ